MKLQTTKLLLTFVSLILVIFGITRVYSTAIAPKYDPSGGPEQRAMVDRIRLTLTPLDIASVALGLGLFAKKRLIARATLFFALVMLIVVVGFRLSFYLFVMVVAPNLLFFEGATGFYNMLDTTIVTLGLLLTVVLLRQNSLRAIMN
jgi:hypothetical protein